MEDLTIAAEKAERLPTFSAQLQGAYSGNRAADLFWSRQIVGLVSVPIFTGGRIAARVAEAQSRQPRARPREDRDGAGSRGGGAAGDPRLREREGAVACRHREPPARARRSSTCRATVSQNGVDLVDRSRQCAGLLSSPRRPIASRPRPTRSARGTSSGARPARSEISFRAPIVKNTEEGGNPWTAEDRRRREIAPRSPRKRSRLPPAEPKKGGGRRGAIARHPRAALVAGGIFGWSHRPLLREPRGDRRRADRSPHRPGAAEGFGLRARDSRERQPEGRRRGRPADHRRPRLHGAGRRPPRPPPERPSRRRRGEVAVQAGETTRAKTAADLSRYAALRQKEEVSQQQFDAAKAAADAAGAQVQADRGQVSAAAAKVHAEAGGPRLARLQLSYATVTAPAAGIVSRKNVEVGQFVQAGQPLLAIVAGRERLGRRELQGDPARADAGRARRVEIEVDAYPKRLPRPGRVASPPPPARSSRCCRPTTPPATSPRSSSASRSRSSSTDPAGSRAIRCAPG